jgi:hypothetical protein
MVDSPTQGIRAMILFTTGDILKLLEDVSSTTFDRWCNDWVDEGIVEPISGGGGHGLHRQWSLMQAVGFVVANRYRQSERGCVPIFIGRTVAAFSNVTEQWLLDQMEKRGAYYVCPRQERPVLQADSGYGNFVNVEEAYQRVKKYAKQKQSSKRETVKR